MKEKTKRRKNSSKKKKQQKNPKTNRKLKIRYPYIYRSICFKDVHTCIYVCKYKLVKTWNHIVFFF